MAPALEIVSKIFGYSLDFGYDFSTPPARNGRVSKINTFWIFLDMRIQKLMKHVAIYSKSALGAYPNVSKRIQSYPNVSKRIQNQNVRVSKNRIQKLGRIQKSYPKVYINKLWPHTMQNMSKSYPKISKAYPKL